mgnify:FL=1
MVNCHARRLSVFLCHASGDKSAVRALYQRLLNDGFQPWLDDEDLLPGQDWEPAIKRAVHNSDVVLVCLSCSAVTKKGFVQKEIKFALDTADEQPEGTIYIVPLKLEDCAVPERLSRWQWVEFFRDNGYDRLLRGLRSLAETRGLELPDPVPSEQAEFDPRLEYEGIVGAEGGYENSALGHPQLVRIRNSQVAVENAAKDVSARIEYHHADGTMFTVTEAAWLAKDDVADGVVVEGIRSSVSIAGNEQQGFVLMQIDKDRKCWASRHMSQAVGLLDVGKWTADITVSSSTCRGLAGTIGFTILPDKRLVYDQPAFRQAELRR